LLRHRYINEINAHFRVHDVCVLLGPRESGKSSLAENYVSTYAHEDAYFFNLEDFDDLARLENPMLVLSSVAQKLIVIDEIQRRPDLFPVLRVLVDQPGNKKKFLILGSASRDLIRQSSETLAGRIGYIELPPFSLFEVDARARLFLRGGFPKSYLAKSGADSYLWRKNYVTTFLERDIPNLGFDIPPQQLRKFWLMLAHYHGQIFNASEIGRALGISGHTVRRYLDILIGTFMIRELQPWFENIQKRQIKSSKIYFKDSGILNALLGIETQDQLDINPKLGAFWEGFALEEIVRTINPDQYYFWSTQAHAELDLLLFKGERRMGFEFKYADAPRMTKSINIVQEDLKLDHIAIIYPGKDIFPLTERVSAYGIDTISTGEFLNHIPL
jgi:predicted AAA+ superfamily ATPase